MPGKKSWQFWQTSPDEDRLTSSPLQSEENQSAVAQQHRNTDVVDPACRMDNGCAEVAVDDDDVDPLLKPRYITLAVLGVLQLADCITTRMALSYGAVESNPLVQALGLWPAKLLALGIIGLLVWRSRSLAKLSILCGAYAGTIVSNLLTVWQASMQLR